MTVSPQAVAPAAVGADLREPGVQPAERASSTDPGAGRGAASLERAAAGSRQSSSVVEETGESGARKDCSPPSRWRRLGNSLPVGQSRACHQSVDNPDHGFSYTIYRELEHSSSLPVCMFILV